MLKLILKTSLVFCLANLSSFSSFSQSLVRNYSSQFTNKTLNSLKPLKIYSSLHWPSKQKQMLSDLTGQGGIMLFLNKNSSLYAIEGSGNLAGYLQDLFNKEMLTILADIKVPKTIQKKTRLQLKTHYQELLHQGWKDYDLYLLETWKASEEVDAKHRLAYYHTKYQPKLNLFRYVYSANEEVEKVYQWNRFKAEDELLRASQKKATLKPLLTYRIDDKSPLDKLKGKVWHENKHKTGIYRWVNRLTKESYVDSSLNLGNLLYTIASSQTLSKSKNSLFEQALQQYSLTNFTLQILAYCSTEELARKEKEQYYLQLYQPEYNRLEDKKEAKPIIDNSLSKSPLSIVGFNALNKQLVLFEPAIKQLTKRSEPLTLSLIPLDTKFIKDKEHLKVSLKNPILEVKTKKTWTLSEATRQKQSLARRQREQQPYPSIQIKVQDLVENKTTIYSSLREASKALNIWKQTISKYLINNQTKPYRKRYIFSKI